MQENKMSLQNTVTVFGKTAAALEAVGLDIRGLIETSNYFKKARLDDPEATMPTYRAKIPSGGGKAFDIITGDESLDVSIPSFRGVIASHHPCNALFDTGENGDMLNEPPVCSSQDGIQGISREGGEVADCADCPNNEWGSGKNGGKLCKNMRRLYILADECSVPIIMTLPPTSIKAWKDYKNRLGVQRLSPYDVVTEFSLTAVMSKGNIKYSVVKFKAAGYVEPETNAVLRALALGGDEQYIKDVGVEDYNAPIECGNE